MAEYEVFRDRAGEYRWRLQAGNNKIVADSSEGYTAKESCYAAIEVVRRIAPTTPINDKT